MKNSDIDTEDEGRINTMYSAVLDHLLIPAAKKEQLMSSQTIEKKKQMLQMHAKLFEPGTSSWADKDSMLLSNILKSKVPDLQSLSRLRVTLASANREFMTSFLDNGGVAVLLKTIDAHVNKKPMSEVDVAVLYEILTCCKAVMNNDVGMEGFAAVDGSLATLARCLFFDFKTLALLVLEILSVCCAISERNASLVLQGLRLQAQHEREHPFASISQAVLQEDVEVQASALLFVNTLLMNCCEADRLTLRAYLRAQCFDERMQQALHALDGELIQLTGEGLEALSIGQSNTNTYNSTNSTSTTAAKIAVAAGESSEAKLHRRSLVALHGRRAIDKRHLQHLLLTQTHKNSQTLGQTSANSNNTNNNYANSPHQFFAVVSQSGLSVRVSPSAGSMAGLLCAAKNADKMEAKLLDFVGGKKTKRRWYELDEQGFKWCGGHDKESDYKGCVLIGSISDVRPYTSDAFVAAETQHCFEIDTADRVFALGCETAQEKDHWVTALRNAREHFLMNQASYKLQHRELQVSDVCRYASALRKQVSVYVHIAEEDVRLQQQPLLSVGDVSVGADSTMTDNSTAHIAVKNLDVSRLEDVSRYVVLEATAHSEREHRAALLSLLQEILLMAPALQSHLLAAGTLALRALRERARDALSVHDPAVAAKAALSSVGHASDNDNNNTIADDNSCTTTSKKKSVSVTEEWRLKVERGGAPYQQLNKLALQLLQTESHATQLATQLRHSEAQNAALQEEMRVLQALVANSSSLNPIHLLNNNNINNNNANNASNNCNSTAGHVSSKSSSRRQLAALLAMKANQKSSVGDADPHSSSGSDNVAEASAEGTSVSPSQTSEETNNNNSNNDTNPNGTDSNVHGNAVSADAGVPVVQERFAKFDKMKKMLPEGAVRQKMMLEGFNEAEIEGFFNGTVGYTTTNSTNGANTNTNNNSNAVVADERYAKFEKMKKMLPEGAVRQKMMLEGFTETEIEGFFNGTIPTSANNPTNIASTATVVDERYVKYDKMRKMLPEGAVRQKMQTDGFSAADIEAYFSGTTSNSSNTNTKTTAVVDERYAKFDKMKKILPEAAVRQKMQGEGFSPAEIDAYFNGTPMNTSNNSSANTNNSNNAIGSNSSSSAMAAVAAAALKKQQAEEEAKPPPGMAPKPSNVPKPRLKVKALFWQKLKNSEVSGTLWHQLEEPLLSAEEQSLLEECFAAKQTTVAATSNTNTGNDASNSSSTASADATNAENNRKLASVLDGKRTQNVLIFLGKLRKTPEEILQLAVKLDSSQLDQELTRTLIDVLPSSEEYAAVQPYTSAQQLDAASRFVFHCRRLPRLQIRLECHETSFLWPVSCQALLSQLDILNKACMEFHESENQLKPLLGLVLSVGNFLNNDSARGQAYGVRLDIFSKLSTLKANNASQGSLLTVVAHLAERRCPSVLSLSSHWLAIFAASEISWKQWLLELNQLQLQVNKMQAERDKIKEGLVNPGLDNQLEGSSGVSVLPLKQRLDTFLAIAVPRLRQVNESKISLESKLEKLFARFGETFKVSSNGNNNNSVNNGNIAGNGAETGEDNVKKFWASFAEFGRAWSLAVEDNKTKKLALEKAQRLAEEEAARHLQKQQQLHNNTTNHHSTTSAANNSDHSTTTTGPLKGGTNLFGNFHSAQATASANDLVAEFKSKLAKQFQQRG